ncbi:hypothetical protein Q0N88_05900 [Bacillus thuringiensis]|nr:MULTISPECIES: hypothetical protein [Bacillus]MEB9338030.1 hypothetical protein [Bacillus cereus]CCW05905.1 hypothetical protein EBGED10_26340 [Bacillus sp. GeD10]
MENQYIEFLKEIEALGKEKGFRVDQFEYGLRKGYWYFNGSRI